MARRRIVKQEIWADERFTSLPPFGRLLFIALWNFADDNGILPNSPTQIKMECLPAAGDPGVEEVKELVSQMATLGLVVLYTVHEDRFLLVKGFNRHQRVPAPRFSHPTPLVDGAEVTAGRLNGWEPREGTPLNLNGQLSQPIVKTDYENRLSQSIVAQSEENVSEEKQVEQPAERSQSNPTDHPFSRAERVLGQVNERLNLPAPSALDIRRHLKAECHLQQLITEFGEDKVVAMRLWVESNWKGNNKSWPAIYNQRYDVSRSAFVTGSPPTEAGLVTPEFASRTAELKRLKASREQGNG